MSFIIDHILFNLIVLPLIGALALLILPSWNAQLLRLTALAFSFFTFLLSLFLWVFFDKSTSNFQFVEQVTWISDLNLNFRSHHILQVLLKS